MAYKGSSTQRRKVELAGDTKEAERNTGGYSRGTYNPVGEYAGKEKDLADAKKRKKNFADAKKRRDDAAAADRREENRGTDNIASGYSPARPKKDKIIYKDIQKKVANKIFGKPIIEITDPNQLALIEKLITNSVGNKPDTNILEDFANALGGLTFGRYKGLLGDEELYRDDGKGIEIGSDADEFMTPGSLTGEGLNKLLRQEFGDDVFASLEKYNSIGPNSSVPMNFLAKGVPSTRGGLESFATKKTVDTSNMDRESDKYEKAKNYNNAIFAARETMNNQKEAYDARQPGIMGDSMAPPPDPDPDPMIPVVPIPAPGTTTPIPTPKYPGSVVNDYTNMGIPNIYGNQQIPTYGYANYNQTGQPVGLQSYLDNLRKRFGIG